MKLFYRQYRIAQEIQKKTAFILQHEIKDPRLYMMATISGVTISRDLMCAKVYVTFLHEGKEHKNIENNIKILQKASSYIRLLLSKIMHLRVTPRLIFFYDYSLMEGIRICNIVSSIVKKQ